MWELGSALEERPFFFPETTLAILFCRNGLESDWNQSISIRSLASILAAFWSFWSQHGAFVMPPLSQWSLHAQICLETAKISSGSCVCLIENQRTRTCTLLYIFFNDNIVWICVNYANFAYLQEFFLALLATVAETLLVDDAFLTSTNGAGQMVTRQTKELPCVEPYESYETKSCRICV